MTHQRLPFETTPIFSGLAICASGGGWPHRSIPAMPTGPKGQKRPADVIGNAIKVARIATGEEEEEIVAPPPKNEAAAELGRKGGAARAKAMTPEKRAEIARKASRWKRPGGKV